MTEAETHRHPARPPRPAGSPGSVDDPGRLVRAAAAGDAHAWDQLVKRFDGLVWAVARSFRLSSADAADVAQTTWLRLVEHLDRIQEADRVGAWLVTTARRECLAHVRRQTHQAYLPADTVERLEDATVRLDKAILDGERDATVWAAFARLSERCQQLLRVLVADPAPSYEDVAVGLGMAVGSIGPTRGRCLEQLRRRLPADGTGTLLVDST